MGFEKRGLRLEAAGAAILCEQGHDFAERRSVVLGLGDVVLTLEAELLHVGAEPRKRLLHQESGEVPRPERDELTAAETDE